MLSFGTFHFVLAQKCRFAEGNFAQEVDAFHLVGFIANTVWQRSKFTKTYIISLVELVKLFIDKVTPPVSPAQRASRMSMRKKI